MKLRRTVCAPIATLTLIGSLVGGANATSLVTWTIDSGNTSLATATMADNTTITATTSGGGYFFDTHQSTSPTWTNDFGNSFFPAVSSGNGLVVADAANTTITFTFSGSTSGIESWYSNAAADLTYSTAISAIKLNEANLTGSFLNNTAPPDNTPPIGPNNPAQSAGIISLDNSVTSFSITAGLDNVQEGIIYGIVNVPEPSSTALLGLGGLALILRRRR